jgi:hypothetical protein
MLKDQDPPRRRILYIASAIAGWVIFVIEWFRISRQTAHADEIILVVVLVLSLLLIHAGTYAWIGHNKRIAASGKRGSISRYASPEFFHDSLGRPLIMGSKVHESKEILVSIDGDTKVYEPVEVPEVVLR